jgi:hypothetical protein
MLYLFLLQGCNEGFLKEDSVMESYTETLDPSCFVEGTQIAMLEGDQPIETIESGDSIWAYDLEQATLVLRRVKQVIESSSSSIYSVETQSTRINGVTHEHPLYNTEVNDWVKMGDLEEGDTVLFRVDNEVFVEKIARIELTKLPQPIPVYNLSVAGTERNYFAEGILVHNKSTQGDSLWAEITAPVQDSVLFEGGMVLKATVSLYLVSEVYDDLNMTLDWSFIDVITGELLPIDGCNDLIRNEPEFEEECAVELEVGDYEVRFSVTDGVMSSTSEVIFSVISE